jgi:hypothetical protein
MTRHTSNVYVTLTGNKMKETEKAVLFQIQKISGTPVKLPKSTQWFPLSQVQKMFKDPTQSGVDTITVSEWILKQKEIGVPAQQGDVSEEPEDFDLDDLDIDEHDVPY